jgi:hypothetical protein
MRITIRAFILFMAATGLLIPAAMAQTGTLDVQKAGETGETTYNAATGAWTPGGTRMGDLIYNNGESAHTWWPIGYANTHYILLDWGVLYNPPTSGLTDEIIDGFQFRYSTNERTVPIEMDVNFFDSCTGAGNLGVMEAMFPFTDLPNASNAAPGVNKKWIINVDLEGSGYEFILGPEIGWAHVYHNGNGITGDPATGPIIGKPPLTGGNGPTGTENRFDTYRPDGSYAGTYWFGGSPWATWPMRLYGGAGLSQTYYGIGGKGNLAELYVAGNWYATSNLTFMMRDPIQLNSYLLPSLKSANIYFPNLDITRFVGDFLFGQPLKYPMMPDPDGRFDRISLKLPNPLPPISVYFQGVSLTVGSYPPIDMSNGIKMN